MIYALVACMAVAGQPGKEYCELITNDGPFQTFEECKTHEAQWQRVYDKWTGNRPQARCYGKQAWTPQD